MTRSLAAAVVLFAAAVPVHSLQLWKTPGEIPSTVPPPCRIALIGDIKCSPRLIRGSEIQAPGALDPAFLTEYCKKECGESLDSYAKKVNGSCGWKAYDWGDGFDRSGNSIAQTLVWNHEVACLKDQKTGNFCVPIIAGHKAKKCDDCTLRYLSSFVDVEMAPDLISETQFKDLLKECSADPSSYPIATRTLGEPNGPKETTAPAPHQRQCLGKNYTVTASDTCKSIAASNNIAIDRFLSENNLDAKCETLKTGDKVCIGSSCKLQEVKANQTCNDILRDQKFTIVELHAWNPILYSDCGNLDSLVGHPICISPPGTDHYDVNGTVTWTTGPTRPPTGTWAPLPTTGRPAGNESIPVVITDAPTQTASGNATATSEWDQIVTNCPVSDDVLEAGFDWEMLSDECSEMLEPYCTQPLPGTTYPASTAFPSSCLPSVILGLGNGTAAAATAGNATLPKRRF
ncbi:hypothetical protein LMH87_010565 [Akanthomyces muscarius]|uniref:LysM domain-containing protein n=1 Tax=Akanthomyces muscarius TaxID=2231603 RepID=A0A9W8QF77_AKAMU|nr:hypothetical protein LMH87_010565 [Akanthomyces muscarius]KAJ4154102.1 hypothetical protein LMH87_010565 [Akanthomyces muscarius]